MGREFGRAGTLRRVEVCFWRLWSEGVPVRAAAAGCAVAETTGRAWVRHRGGVRPRHLVVVGPAERSRALSEAEREEIALGLAAGRSLRAIARQLGRAPSTISREVARNRLSRGQAARDHAAAGGQGPVIGYRASVAQFRAEARRRRPKPRKLSVRPDLAAVVEDGLGQRWSPRQIAASLRRRHRDRPELWVSHETIYQSLFVQGRGGLRAELHAALRTGRALRRPRGGTRGPGGIAGAVSISQRPAEAGDRAVPGHWEGDLIIGKDGRSAIGTLVERATRYCLLLHLPHGHGPEQVRDAMIATIATLPAHRWRSLTWDRGIEMARHHEITLATGLQVYFADPHSPWQRGSNENTNGLLRQYFPKGTDLSVHTREHLAAVAVQLNGRPRQTLDWRTPAEALNELLSKPFNTTGVAFTP
jgi:transposase, IS30 family